MPQTTQASDSFDQQPFLPSCSEATKTAPQSSNIPNFHNYSIQPSAPIDGFIPGQMPQPQYPYQQINYNQWSIPTASPYPPPHPTNTYLQAIPITDQTGHAPTTVHVIRPVTQQPPTRKTWTRVVLTILVVLAIILMIVRLGVYLSR